MRFSKKPSCFATESTLLVHRRGHLTADLKSLFRQNPAKEEHPISRNMAEKELLILPEYFTFFSQVQTRVRTTL